MDPQDYSARVQYRPPARWYRRLNGLGAVLARLGLVPSDVVSLEVRGRRTGRTRRVPVVQVRERGDTYLVSLAGESQWVRNVRAAGGEAALVRRGRSRSVRLVEVPVADRVPVIAAYLRAGVERGGERTGADQARFYFGVDADPTEQQLRDAAPYYPVFRVDGARRLSG